MSKLVSNGRFVSDDIGFDWSAYQKGIVGDANALDVPSNADIDDLVDQFSTLKAVRIAFPSSADGRGFSLASFLRQAGFTGHIRAIGPLHSDQYPLALRCGIDAIEIPDDLAARQPEHLWQEAMQRVHGGYREMLMQSASQHDKAA